MDSHQVLEREAARWIWGERDFVCRTPAGKQNRAAAGRPQPPCSRSAHALIVTVRVRILIVVAADQEVGIECDVGGREHSWDA